jgi:hypothetical protein
MRIAELGNLSLKLLCFLCGPRFLLAHCSVNSTLGFLCGLGHGSLVLGLQRLAFLIILFVDHLQFSRMFLLQRLIDLPQSLEFRIGSLQVPRCEITALL